MDTRSLRAVIVALIAVTLMAGALMVAPLPAAAQEISLQVVTSSLGSPVGVTGAGDGSGRLFIVEQEGEILIWDGTQILPVPFLDIIGPVLCCGERGLLGVAFHPDYANNGFFYVNYTNNAGDTVISRFEVSADPNLVDPDTETIVMLITQPFSNHNGGDIAFGPDGFLYVPTGDGGSGGDPGDRAQTLSVPLGKLLRIDVDGELPYEIPADNPFIDDPLALDEIWAYGLRNPWRFGFDRETGDLFIGDVGQGEIEEIDFQPVGSEGGENYGWRLMEGTECSNPPVNCNDGSLVLPILEYHHFDPGYQGCAVIGGRRYRGPDFPGLEGLYFYADNCTGKVWAGVESGGTWTSSELLDTSISITSFGEDDDGNVYVVGSGQLLRLVDAGPFCAPRVSQDVYNVGEVLVIEELRLANLGVDAQQARLQIVLQPPAGSPIGIIDAGADGQLILPDATERNLGPLILGPFPGGAPLGDYELRCRLSVPLSGTILAEHASRFTLQD